MRDCIRWFKCKLKPPKNRTFKHKFIVCSALKAQMILGLDFAQTYRIGIDWDNNMEPCLRSEGKFLTSAMPLQTLNLGLYVKQHPKIKGNKTQPSGGNCTYLISK